MQLPYSLDQLRARSSAEVLSLSSGEVRKPDTYNYGTFVPERGGLYSEEVFGPWTGPRSARSSANLSHETRSDRWGHIVLAESCVHPLVGSVLTHVLVVPPIHRRFVERSAEYWRAVARRRRAELQTSSGDTRELEKWLREDGLDDEQAITEAAHEEPRLNSSYRQLINWSYRISRLRELGAPTDILSSDVQNLQKRVAGHFQIVEEWVAQLPAGTHPDVVLGALGLGVRG